MLCLDDKWKIHAHFPSEAEAVKDFKWLLKYATKQREFKLVTNAPNLVLNDEIPF